MIVKKKMQKKYTLKTIFENYQRLLYIYSFRTLLCKLNFSQRPRQCLNIFFIQTELLNLVCILKS